MKLPVVLILSGVVLPVIPLVVAAVKRRRQKDEKIPAVDDKAPVLSFKKRDEVLLNLTPEEAVSGEY